MGLVRQKCGWGRPSALGSPLAAGARMREEQRHRRRLEDGRPALDAVSVDVPQPDSHGVTTTDSAERDHAWRRVVEHCEGCLGLTKWLCDRASTMCSPL